jgi:putative SOS response-associated peptidase YedK
MPPPAASTNSNGRRHLNIVPSPTQQTGIGCHEYHNIMCGRFTLYSPLNDIKKAFDIDTVTTGEMKPSYNIAPGNEIYAVIRGKGNRLGKLHWGLVPPWAKSLSGTSKLINARIETLQEKPSFKKAFHTKRCLIPVNGFYEWKNKQPWYCMPATGTLFAFAGLWETWKKSTESRYHSCAIITTEARKPIRDIHHRMPVILTPNAIEAWLDPAMTEYEKLHTILQNGMITDIKAYRVSKLVDSPGNNDPQCIEPLSD